MTLNERIEIAARAATNEIRRQPELYCEGCKEDDYTPFDETPGEAWKEAWREVMRATFRAAVPELFTDPPTPTG